MGKGSGGGGNSTQTVNQKADPWIGVQPYLNQLYPAASNWYNNSGSTQKAYPGQTVAGFNQAQTSGMQGIQDQYVQSQPQLMDALGAGNWLAHGNSAYNYDSNPLYNGSLLKQDNPYLHSMVDAAEAPIVSNFQNAVAPSLASQFSAAGRLGSGASLQANQNAQQTLAQQLGFTSANLYGQDYASRMGAYQQALMGMPGQKLQQQQIQTGALAMLPALSQSGYYGAQQQLAVGNQQQQQTQAQIDSAMQNYNYNRDAPLNSLLSYNSILSGAAPYAASNSASSGTNKPPNSPVAGAIGGGLAGYQIGSLAGSTYGPYGAAIGAVLGGLYG